MPKVTYKRNRLLRQDMVVEAKSGQTLLDLAQQHGLPVGSNCGGVCGCSTCHVYLAAGLDSLEEMSDKEADRLDRAFDVKLSSRLSCQAEVGDQDLVVEITEESLRAFLDEHPAIRHKIEAGWQFEPQPEK